MIDARKFDDMLVPVPDHLMPQFDMSKEKFLHNIDSFYYSVYLQEDLSTDSVDDVEINNFREWFQDRLGCVDSSGLPVQILGDSFILRRSALQQHYKACLSIPDQIDIFVSPKLPPLKNKDDDNLLPVFIVQIRSCSLWMDGIKGAIKSSFSHLQLIVQFFRFHIKEIQENRIDFCWHTNYFHDPEKYLNPERFAKMCVSRLKIAPYKNIGHFVGENAVSTSYLALGTRGGHVYFRIYDKVREVLEMHYKPWFFQIWRNEGLINDYDLYCFTYAFQMPAKWSRVYGLNIARLIWALENLSLSAADAADVTAALDNVKSYKADHVLIQKLADQFAPKLTKVYNVEYEVKRGMLRNLDIPLPVQKQMPRLAFITLLLPDISDYLTSKTLRLVSPEQHTRLTNCEDCYFWKRLRAAKLRSLAISKSDRGLVRNYTKNLNLDIIRNRLINGSITYGLYDDPDSEGTLKDDVEKFMSSINDNDMAAAQEKKDFKRKLLYGNRPDNDCFQDSFTENFEESD